MPKYRENKDFQGWTLYNLLFRGWDGDEILLKDNKNWKQIKGVTLWKSFSIRKDKEGWTMVLDSTETLDDSCLQVIMKSKAQVCLKGKNSWNRRVSKEDTFKVKIILIISKGLTTHKPLIFSYCYMVPTWSALQIFH